MKHLKSTLAVFGAVGVLLLAGNTIALAATGQALLLGKSNSANTITALTRSTAGSGLKVTTHDSSNSPFLVNGKGKVTNLNADTVDGYDSTAMRNRAYAFKADLTSATADFLTILNVPNGTYEFSYSALLDSPTAVTWCQIIRVPSTGILDATYVAVTQIDAATGSPTGLSGAGLVTKATGDKLEFNCGSGGGSFITEPAVPIQIVLSPTTVIGGGTVTQAPKVHVSRPTAGGH